MLDRSIQKPLHQQMEEILRKNIADGTWPATSRIPSENQMSSEFGISRMTARNVVTKLVQEGLLVRIVGKGTFVCEPKITAKSLSYAGIREQLEQMGYEVTTELLSLEKVTVTKGVYAIFEADSDALFYEIRRLRRLKGVPLSLHTSYIPVSLCADIESFDLVNTQLCSILSNNYGLVRTKTVETLESIAANKTEASLLSIKIGQPLLLLNDMIYDGSGKVFEYAKVAFKGDSIKLHLEF